MISITALACALIWFSKRGTVKVKDMHVSGSQLEPVTAKKGRVDWLLIYVIIYLLFLYIPSVMLPIFSFNDGIHMVLPLKEFTLKWYAGLAQAPGLIEALGNSLRVAFPVAIATTTLATLAAKALTRYRMPGRSLAIGFILTPMVIPGIILR